MGSSESKSSEGAAGLKSRTIDRDKLSGIPHTQLLKQAETASKAGHLDQALPLYDCAIEAHPQYYLSYLCRGKCFMSMGDYQDAIDDFEVAVSLSESCYAARLLKVACLEEIEEFEEAAMERSRLPPEWKRKSVEQFVSLPSKGTKISPLRLAPSAPTAAPEGRKTKGEEAPSEVSAAVATRDADGFDGVGFPEGAARPEKEGSPSKSKSSGTKSLRDSLCCNDDTAAPRYVAVEGATATTADGRPPRKGDIVDEEDKKRFAEYEAKWKAEATHARNIRNFINGKRGWYVQDPAKRRAATRRADRQQQLAMYDVGRGPYQRVGE
jgi:hypothetical protein